jgi:uncharacterized protein YkwD
MRTRAFTALAATGVLITLLIAAVPPVAPAQAQAASGHDRLERAIVREVNRARAHSGVRALRTSVGLRRVARRHSLDQLRDDRLSHQSSGGRSLQQRLGRYARGGRRAGEVVGFMPRGASDRARTIVGMWLRSPSHRDQVLSRSYRYLGVGRRTGTLGSAHGTVVTANLGSQVR